MKINVSKHCRERYKERISGENTDIKILLYQISHGKDITMKVYEEAPRYILFLYEKYKTASQKILLFENIIFILIHDKNTDDNNIITCYRKTENFLDAYKNCGLSRQIIYDKIALIKKKIKNENSRTTYKFKNYRN